GGTAIERTSTDGTHRNLMPISEPHMSAFALDSQGDYFYTGHSWNDQLWVEMYTGDGLYITTGRVGPGNGGSSGWIDHGMGLTAFTDPATGTHYAYGEDVYFGKSIRFRIDSLDTLQRSQGNFTLDADPLLVTNTSDSGVGSPRQAILTANAHPGADVIRFDIPGNTVDTITPLTAIPAITDSATI